MTHAIPPRPLWLRCLVATVSLSALAVIVVLAQCRTGAVADQPAGTTPLESSQPQPSQPQPSQLQPTPLESTSRSASQPGDHVAPRAASGDPQAAELHGPVFMPSSKSGPLPAESAQAIDHRVFMSGSKSGPVPALEAANPVFMPPSKAGRLILPKELLAPAKPAPVFLPDSKFAPVPEVVPAPTPKSAPESSSRGKS